MSKGGQFLHPHRRCKARCSSGAGQGSFGKRAFVRRALFFDLKTTSCFLHNYTKVGAMMLLGAPGIATRSKDATRMNTRHSGTRCVVTVVHFLVHSEASCAATGVPILNGHVVDTSQNALNTIKYCNLCKTVLLKSPYSKNHQNRFATTRRPPQLPSL